MRMACSYLTSVFYMIIENTSPVFTAFALPRFYLTLKIVPTRHQPNGAMNGEERQRE